MSPGLKLAIGASVIAGATAYMAYVGAASSWQYYVTADECLADSGQFVGSRVRVSGTVAPGTLKISEERMQANFCLQGQEGQLDVACKGPLPDNLEESMEVVVEGRYEAGGRISGDKVLTRCASKYESQSQSSAINSPPESATNTRGRE